MVSISRALLGAPGVVLLDEPSQGLAPKVVQDVLRMVRRLKAEGIASLIVEQNALAALEVADRVYVMERGLIVHEGPAAELLDNAGKRRRLIGM
jgi:branched-chain amino acid transport system ATP-binding protein